jgi:DNA-binding MarR family transcriptional regulator
MDNNDTITRRLQESGLSAAESQIYLSLLREPATVLRLSKRTDIARTTVYRLLGGLEKRSLVIRQTDEQGTLYTATDPTTLEITLAAQEEELRRQRTLLHDLIPDLTGIQNRPDTSNFAVRVYEGDEGFKQMCWHELKATGELLSIGAGNIEQLLPNHHRSEKHRELSMRAGYIVREIINYSHQRTTGSSQEYLEEHYFSRTLNASLLPTDTQTVIYNDTVSVYHLKPDKKVGVEIINPGYAMLMRSWFEFYWQQSTEI